MAPPESYNYHPIISPPDPENPSPYDGETTCSICYEEVDLYPRSSALSLSTHVHSRSNSLDKKSSSPLSPAIIPSKDKISREKESEREGLLGGLGGLDRRNYAIAPCGHVFHTSCLAQWMSIKVRPCSLVFFLSSFLALTIGDCFLLLPPIPFFHIIIISPNPYFHFLFFSPMPLAIMKRS